MFFNMNEEDRFQQDYLFFYFLCNRGGIQSWCYLQQFKMTEIPSGTLHAPEGIMHQQFIVRRLNDCRSVVIKKIFLDRRYDEALSIYSRLVGMTI